jgi:hypothetical protein
MEFSFPLAKFIPISVSSSLPKYSFQWTPECVCVCVCVFVFNNIKFLFQYSGLVFVKPHVIKQILPGGHGWKSEFYAY